MKVIQIGNIMKGISNWENPSVGRVYEKKALAPTLNSGGGWRKATIHSGGGSEK